MSDRNVLLGGCLVLVLLVGFFPTPSYGQCDYECCPPSPPGTGCVTGSCGTRGTDSGYVCRQPTNSNVCSCVSGGTVVLVSITTDCPSAIPLTMGMVRVALGSGFEFFATGAAYCAALHSTDSFTMNNQDEWGTVQNEQVPAVYSAGIVFEFEANENPNLRTIHVTSFTARIPTFAHSKIAPYLTGQNNFDLDGAANYGQVDMTTGEFFVDLHAKLTNNVYHNQDPRFVKMRVSGTMDPETLDLTAFVDGIAMRQD